MRSCLCLSLLFYFGYLLQLSYAQSCQTPFEINGNCVNLFDCQPMIKLLSSLRKPYPPAVARTLSAYKCGSRREQKVCCPPGTIIYNPQDLYHNREVPPDVSNHRNIGLLPTNNCGFLDDTLNKIVGGENTYMNEYPWMALLQYKTSQGLEFLCGGTIINWNYILTAGHCVNQRDAELVSVRVGEYSLKNSTDCEVQQDRKRTIKCNPPVQDLRIEKIIVHPQFILKDKNVLNDVALLRVSRITKADNVFPVCLPVGELRDAAFYNGFVAGWGITDSRRKLRADILQKLRLPIAEKSTCEANYREIRVDLAKTQICAGKGDGRGSCAGDSGGPLLVAGFIDGNFIYVQQGVVTAGPVVCELKRYPGIYTGVKFYMDWILDNMES